MRKHVPFDITPGFTLHTFPDWAAGSARLRAGSREPGDAAAAARRRCLVAADSPGSPWPGLGPCGEHRLGARACPEPRSAKMAPVEHVVADAGAFLRDAALQVVGAPLEKSRVWAGDPCRRAGDRAVVSWAGLSAGHWEEHLHHPGCGQRDSGQGHAPETRRPALRAAFQGALPGIRATG